MSDPNSPLRPHISAIRAEGARQIETAEHSRDPVLTQVLRALAAGNARAADLLEAQAEQIPVTSPSG